MGATCKLYFSRLDARPDVEGGVQCADKVIEYRRGPRAVSNPLDLRPMVRCSRTTIFAIRLPYARQMYTCDILAAILFACGQGWIIESYCILSLFLGGAH
jgi:hypothetical protein